MNLIITKNNFVIIVAVIIIIGGLTSFGYQMYEHNTRTVEQLNSIDIPDHEDSSGEWIKYTGSNSCPILVEQRFDANKSHYICIYQR